MVFYSDTGGARGRSAGTSMANFVGRNWPQIKAAAAAAGLYYTARRSHGYAKRKYAKQTRYKRKSQTKMNKKRISYLNKKLNNNEATIVYRKRDNNDSQIGAVDTCAYKSFDGLNKSIVELSITNLKYFDPSAPTVLQTVDYNAGTFNKQILVQPKCTFLLRNNYRVPVMCELYICRVKSDTSQSPRAALVAGLTDVGNLADNDIQSKVSDSMILKDLWNVKKVYKGMLQAGSQKTFMHYEKPFSYDTSLADTHNLTYIKQFKSFSWLTRLEGVVGHNPSGSVQGKLEGGIDIIMDTQIIVKYDAGIDLFEVQTTNNNGLLATPVVTVLDNSQEAYGF